MPSPINTGGFAVQAQPNINFLPPSAFSSGVADIIPNMSQGVGFAQQLQKISDEAKMRPMLEQIQQIKLQQAQAQLDQIPMEQKMQQLALLQQLERPVVTDEEVIGGAFDDTGNPFGGSGVMKRGYTRDQNLNPIPFERIVIQETDEERNRKFKAAQQQAIRDAAYAASLNARAADAGNPDNDWVPRYRGQKEEGGPIVVEEYNKRTGDIRTRETELKPIKSQLDGIGTAINKLIGGSASPVKATAAAPMFSLNAPPAPQQAAAADEAAVDAETQALIDALSGTAVKPTSFSFSTMEEAEAAAKKGAIKKGQKITVGGQSGTWQ